MCARRVKKREEHKIIVVGLPNGSTSAELTKLVKPYGNPLQANVALDADGKERGFGFVQFGDAAACDAAIKALDKSVFGCVLLTAHPPRPQPRASSAIPVRQDAHAQRADGRGARAINGQSEQRALKALLRLLERQGADAPLLVGESCPAAL